MCTLYLPKYSTYLRSDRTTIKRIMRLNNRARNGTIADTEEKPEA